MLKPAEMKRIELLVLERDVRAVAEGLGRLGVIHLSEATAADGGELVSASKLEGQLTRIRRFLERVDLLIDTLGVRRDREPEAVPYMELDALDEALAPIESQLEGILHRRQELDKEIEAEYQVLRDVEAFRPVEAAPDQLRDLSFLHFAIGSLPAGAADDVREEAADRAVLLPFKSPDGHQRLIALTSRTGRFALQSILDGHGFQPEQLPDLKGALPAEVVGKTQERLLALAKEQEAIRAQCADVAEDAGARLVAYLRRLRVDEQLLAAQAYFGRTASTCLISGYVPALGIEPLREEMLRLTDGRVVIEVTDPPEDDANIPTMMKNPGLLKPFEMLVAGYGYPGYDEIEPTPLVAISFLLMFGVMFGDIGHGLALVVAGVLLNRRAQAETVRDFGTLLWMAGCASIIFGWVFGSIFGYEGALNPPVGGWFEPMRGGNIQRLLVATIVLGVVVISIGVVLNIINRIKKRDYFHLVLDRFGIVGFIFYWGALGLGVHAMVLGGKASLPAVLLLVVLPLAMLFFREPVHFLLTRKDRTQKFDLLGGLIEGFVDILETLSSYIANTVSFVRVGAFALAHTAVCVAIFATEAIVRDMPGGPLWSVLVVVGGNVFVIVLEGLVVSIQAMRLEYYEFFSKFFKGEGKAYRPFRLTDSR